MPSHDEQKLTITVDAELLPLAKRYARSRGVSLSSLIEQSLREVAAARACGARFIVTRNVRDYARSPIRAVDPQTALRDLF